MHTYLKLSGGTSCIISAGDTITKSKKKKIIKFKCLQCQKKQQVRSNKKEYTNPNFPEITSLRALSL